MTDRPLIFLDVDGPLIPFRPRPGSADTPAGDWLHRLDPADGRRLLALDATLVWATTWMETANDLVAPRIGLPALPVVAFPDDDRVSGNGLHWKTATLTQWAGGRPFVWLDDELTDTDRDFVADHHPGPALLHRVDPFTGLTDDDLTQVHQWLRTARPRRTPPMPPPSVRLTPAELAHRTVGPRTGDIPVKPITIHAYDPSWPARFTREQARVRAALGTRVLALDHVGSTAVPGLPAKNRIDIDLIVADPADEDTYVSDLTAAGYRLRTREPHWYEHRCLWTANHDVNLHVFGPDCDEHLRHLIFRDWLRTHPADRDLYAAHKFEAAARHPNSASAYVHAKGAVIREILHRAGLR